MAEQLDHMGTLPLEGTREVIVVLGEARVSTLAYLYQLRQRRR
jgi:hypothetical protein